MAQGRPIMWFPALYQKANCNSNRELFWAPLSINWWSQSTSWCLCTHVKSPENNHSLPPRRCMRWKECLTRHFSHQGSGLRHKFRSRSSSTSPALPQHHPLSAFSLRKGSVVRTVKTTQRELSNQHQVTFHKSWAPDNIRGSCQLSYSDKLSRYLCLKDWSTLIGANLQSDAG